MRTLLPDPNTDIGSNVSQRVRKPLSNEQKSQAADTFGAEREFLSAGKKMLHTSHPAIYGG